MLVDDGDGRGDEWGRRCRERGHEGRKGFLRVFDKRFGVGLLVGLLDGCEEVLGDEDDGKVEKGQNGYDGELELVEVVGMEEGSEDGLAYEVEKGLNGREVDETVEKGRMVELLVDPCFLFLGVGNGVEVQL